MAGIEIDPENPAESGHLVIDPETESRVIRNAIDEPSEKLIQVAKKAGKEAAKQTIQREAEERQIRYTEVLGVFVALFTFVSINIQIFSRVSSLRNALIFVILMFLSLAGFVYLLNAVLHEKNKKDKILWYVIVSFIAAMIFVLFLINPGPLSFEESNEIKQINDRLIRVETRLELQHNK